MTHTPGPWKVTGNNKLLVEPLGVESHHNEWGSGGGAIIGASQVYNKRTIKEAQANARLIAAAPELLEACKWMLDWIEEYKSYISDGPIGDNEAYTKAQAAIAKAEGM